MKFRGKIQIHRKRPVQKSSIVKQVAEKVDVDDPSTQRAIGKSVNVSQSTICRIIIRTKRKVQKFTVSNIQKRCQRAPGRMK